MKKKILPVLVAACLLAGCTLTQDDSQSDSQSQNNPTYPTESGVSDSDGDNSSEESEPAENPSVRLLCAGDNLIHTTLYDQAKQYARKAGKSGYDFSYIYEDVKDIVAAADYAVLNQETIITDDYPASGYPDFATPGECGDLMVDIGFDAFSISNNHVLDKGAAGLKSTLKWWSENLPESLVYGASTREKEDEIPVVEINGITFAFLGFMEYINQGHELPSGSDMSVTYLGQTERVKKLVKEADELADVVVVSPHYGLETTGEVQPSQKQMTQDLVDWGADIIIGTQAHTLQPMEWVTKPDGGEAFVFYCLGNFVSHMDIPLGVLGMIGEVTVTKDLETGEITLSEPEALPIVTHYDNDAANSNLKIYRWEDYTEELAAKHGCPGFTYSFAKATFDEQLKIVDYLP